MRSPRRRRPHPPKLMQIPTSPGIARRHDLDALRGGAMLLGIVLHASLSVAGNPWMIQSDQSSEGLKHVFHFIHVFRMPLFFLLSGYFSVMLWQRRGVRGLARQRLLRIGLPLLIGAYTVVPLTENAMELGMELQRRDTRTGGVEMPAARLASWAGSEALGPATDLTEAAKEGDLARLKELLDAGADVDGADGSELTALHWASAWGHADACRLLIERGAEVGARDGRDATPLHAAAFFGRPDAVRVLLEGGADPSLRNEDGTSPADLADWPWDEARLGLTRLMAGLMSVPLDETTIEGDLAATAELLQRSALGRLLKDLGEFSLGHLWFLWFLVPLSIGLAVVLGVLGQLGRSAPGSWTVSLGFVLLVLVPATGLTTAFQRGGLTMPGFGPDTSFTLSIDLHVLVHYAVFFAFGGLVRAVDPDTRLVTRRWPALLMTGIAAYFLTIDAALAAPAKQGEDTVLGVMLGESICVWGLVLGTIGLTQRVLTRERHWVRVVADGSYWAYLMHMALVFVLQGWLAATELGPWVQVSITCAVTFVVMGVTYLTLVRPTPIGTLLNGPLRRPAGAAPQPS